MTVREISEEVITQSRAFAFLQQGMKDKQAYQIVLCLMLTCPEYDEFERFCENELKEREATK